MTAHNDDDHRYINTKTGEIVEVMRGLDGLWICGVVTRTGAVRPFVSRELPPTADRETAQKNLLWYITKRGWMPVSQENAT